MTLARLGSDVIEREDEQSEQNMSPQSRQWWRRTKRLKGTKQPTHEVRL
jgi:hypothetical protein